LPSAVDQAQAVIEERIREVEDEIGRLRKALASLGQNQRPSRRTRRRPRSRTRAVRARRGQRQEQLLAVLGKKPGIKPADEAKEMGISANQVHGLARRLRQEGRIRKRRGGGYALEG
jgi:hypothetical protein